MILQNLVNGILQTQSDDVSLTTRNFYKTLLQAIPGGLSIATDESCEEILHNSRATQFLRIKEFESFPYTSLQPPSVKVLSIGKELSFNDMPMRLAAINNEEIKGFELEFVWEDGVRKTALWTARPFHEENGNVAGVIASFEEITQQKQVENSLRQESKQLFEYFKWLRKSEMDIAQSNKFIADIINNMSDAFYVLDNQWRFKYVNNKAEKFLKISREKLLGENLWKIIPQAKGALLEQNFRKAKKDCIPITFEYLSTMQFRTWYQITVCPSQFGMSVILKDITEQKLTSEKFNESQEQMVSILENMTDGFCAFNRDWQLTYINHAGEKLFKKSRNELLGKTIIEIEHNDIALKHYHDVMNEMRAVTFEIIATEEGDKWIEITAYPTEDGMRCYFRDITSRKVAEETLRQSEEKFSKAFHGVPIMMTLATVEEGKFIDANEAMCSGTGYTREELIGSTTKQLNFFVDTVRRQEQGKEIMVHRKINNLEFDFRTKSGEIRSGSSWSQLFYFDGEPCHITGLIDVTEQKRMQQEIVEQMQELSKQNQLLNLAHDYIMVRDKNCAITFWNMSAELDYGWTAQETYGKISCKLLNTQFPTSFREVQKELFTKGSWEGELIHTKKDGTQIVVDSHQSLMRDKDGEVVAILEINRDITDRKRMEETIRNNEILFGACFDNMLDCIDISTAIRDETGQITDFRLDFSNKASCLAKNKAKEELIGKSYIELIDNYVKKEQFYQFCKVIETDEPIICKSISSDWRFLNHAAGFYNYTVFKFKDGFVLTYRDVTKQKKMEQEIARLDRLNLIGQMAAGIGHEVRNPMTTVRGFLQLLGSKEECSKNMGYFALMIDEIDRANSIITEYLSLAKDKCLELKAQNLKNLVEYLIPLIQSEATISDNYVQIDLGEVEEILLDKAEMTQLIINLIRNGLQAILPGGTVKIRTFMDKEEIVLAVEDDGIGIAKEVLEKIGTPFFTTKEKGTGLGLAICYSIADRHNAKIVIKTGSEGTSFFVRFKK